MSYGCLWSTLFMEQAVLLAERGRFVHMGRRFRRGSSGSDASDLLLLVGVLIAVAVAAWLASYLANAKNRPGYNSPRGLFRELCRAHQLDLQDRRILRRVARREGLEQPASLFLAPERLPEGEAEPGVGVAERLRQLRQRLFRTDQQEPSS